MNIFYLNSKTSRLWKCFISKQKSQSCEYFSHQVTNVNISHFKPRISWLWIFHFKSRISKLWIFFILHHESHFWENIVLFEPQKLLLRIFLTSSHDFETSKQEFNDCECFICSRFWLFSLETTSLNIFHSNSKISRLWIFLTSNHEFHDWDYFSLQIKNLMI